jgi:hypothetical protein
MNDGDEGDQWKLGEIEARQELCQRVYREEKRCQYPADARSSVAEVQKIQPERTGEIESTPHRQGPQQIK